MNKFNTKIDFLNIKIRLQIPDIRARNKIFLFFFLIILMLYFPLRFGQTVKSTQPRCTSATQEKRPIALSFPAPKFQNNVVWPLPKFLFCLQKPEATKLSAKARIPKLTNKQTHILFHIHKSNVTPLAHVTPRAWAYQKL